MLSNAYFLAKIRFDTAENEPAKNLQSFAKFANFADTGGTGVTGCSVSGVIAAHNTFDFSGLMGAAVIFIGGMMSHYNIPRLYEEFHVKDPGYVCSNTELERMFITPNCVSNLLLTSSNF